MRHYEFATTLVEAVAQKPKLQAGTPLQDNLIDRDTIEGLLKQAGFNGPDALLWKSKNELQVLIEIPEGEKTIETRIDTLNTILQVLKKGAPKSKPSIVGIPGKVGEIHFGDGAPIKVLVKDAKGKGGGSGGKKNEENLRSMLQILIMEYGKINVTFADPTGKKISIKNCTDVKDASMTVADRQKADLVLSSSKGSLPISLKQINADTWESGDSLFGPRAGVIIKNLVKQGVVDLVPIGTKKNGSTIFKLSKEVVVEPSEEDAMNAIFGSDLLSKGGVAIQTFKDEHFTTNGNNVTIQCDYVITKKEDIPPSHLMVWLIRNDSKRGSEDSGVGIPGVRVLGAVLSRGIGALGNKDVVLVDQNGKVLKGERKPAASKHDLQSPFAKAGKDIKPTVGREKR